MLIQHNVTDYLKQESSLISFIDEGQLKSISGDDIKLVKIMPVFNKADIKENTAYSVESKI